MRAVMVITALLWSCFAAATQMGTTTTDGETDAQNAVEAAKEGGFAGLVNWFRSGKAPPEEGSYQLPPVSSLGNWVDYEFTQPKRNKTNTYQISLDGITVGSDEIIRYVMAVKPNISDVTTVVYEGIDCNSNQYRRYASTTSDKDWVLVKSRKWLDNRKDGPNAWQGYLSDAMCSLYGPHSLETIKANIKGNRTLYETATTLRTSK
ncbi:hypothetical protein HQ393_12815 [Chitinibacter bivalviorum]|uniref:CNP1-like uncharacterized domain-containing protein n=1 Tax=Chitinibacter bivalviorum TaxID=2739434 RepID=A0A7H9BKM8_9NEIS|nr:CNP1-like family protein [Chitinibacter bivalviorum]QLG89049.1 hypothetical protein HQ393_12815 [Chitinibacter bivalviorum]